VTREGDTPTAELLPNALRTPSAQGLRTSADRIHPQGSNRCGDFQSILGSRSKMTNLGADPNGNASRNCWTIHKLVGCLVTIEVQDTPTDVTDDEKAIKHAEGDRRNSEEAPSRRSLPVIAEKGKGQRLAAPDLSRRPFHPTKRSFAQRHQTEHENSPWMRGAPPRGFSQPSGKSIPGLP